MTLNVNVVTASPDPEPQGKTRCSEIPTGTFPTPAYTARKCAPGLRGCGYNNSAWWIHRNFQRQTFLRNQIRLLLLGQEKIKGLTSQGSGLVILILNIWRNRNKNAPVYSRNLFLTILFQAKSRSQKWQSGNEAEITSRHNLFDSYLAIVFFFTILLLSFWTGLQLLKIRFLI